MPVRSDDLVLTLLGRALELLPRDQAEAMAEEVGRTYGATMAAGLTGPDVAAGQRSLRSALQAVAAMRAQTVVTVPNRRTVMA